jgi:hypothetical protein
LEAGSTRAEIKRTARYRMLTGGVQTLVADPVRGTSALEVRFGSRTYVARLDLMRNTAVALSPSKKEAAHINGGLTNRSYEADFDAEDAHCQSPSSSSTTPSRSGAGSFWRAREPRTRRTP